MSLLNVFRPKWQHSDPEVRIKALQELGPENQDVFETVATSDEAVEVRAMAIRKLTVISALRQLSKEEKDPLIKRTAENKLNEEIVKILKEFRGTASDLELSYVDEIANTRFAEELLKTMPSSELRLALVQKCNKPGFLSVVALKDSKEEVALAAVSAIDSETLLQDIAKNSRHNTVRQKANEKLKAQKAEPQTATSATMMLFKKREALIQQAKRIIEDKSCLSHTDEFNGIIAEASALGMGPAQAELDGLHETFKEKCREELAKKEEEQKQKQLLELKVGQLDRYLEEFEKILNDNKVKESQLRVNEIIDFWNTHKDNVPAALIKRFTAAISRFDRLSLVKEEKDPSDEKAETIHDDSIVQSMRLEIIEQLKHLAQKDFSEVVSRQVKSLISNWESLPAILESDVLFETYNSLKNQISETFDKASALQDEIFQSNLVKLQNLIKKIKSIDENVNFRDIAKTLKDSYQEWKEIVGEDKYRYQEIWKEYKEATSRFQEMQQWESWHNERDRETILEEMAFLLKEEPSKEVLFKLRTLSNQWKTIGPVAPSRITELREQFRELFEKIMERCSPLLEEQNAERQKNLEQKEALCERAEKLVSDETIPWKDKFKQFIDLQNEWKTIGQVPKEMNQILWDRFHAITDSFYAEHKERIKQEDLIRQENYEKKQALCEQAEKLQISENWNETSNKLKKLQEEWKAIGPVPKSQSDEIWNRFRTACDKFFEQKRSHFEEMDEAKQANLKAKEALCEKLESLELDFSNPATLDTLRSIEAEWKAIGMVPKENIESIWERFSSITNKILESYAEINEETRNNLNEIKAKKKAMIEQIANLMENAGANQSADITRSLQQEWKTLGSCGIDDFDLHKEFKTICDEFFTRRRDQLDIQEHARKNNLQKKYMLCEQAEQLLENLNESNKEDSMNQVKHLRRLWKEVGAVPREHSDKVWKRFNKACDAIFGKDSSTNTDPVPEA
ncbi:MAG TPA: DUF349 domain-containing protein [Fibrobacteraceae bacterium]|jgi:hypothetical protein|nr:DUF349 domain-containing protein [Fibrobacter sp.]HPW94337.1 DUF349 domain-containing protein [Fibrobacteraceae bacterium]